MKLIAQKRCSFGGKKFYIGDEIPAELVLNPKAQESMGVIAIASDAANTVAPEIPPADPVDTINVVIHAEEGDLPLNLTVEGLQAIIDVMTDNVEGAEPIVEKMTDNDALILLHNLETRKTIKVAAEARAKSLASLKESEGEL